MQIRGQTVYYEMGFHSVIKDHCYRFVSVPLTVFIISDFVYIVSIIFTVFINYFAYIIGNKIGSFAMISLLT